MKRKKSMYSYEKSAEVAHLLPLRNNSNLDFIKNTATITEANHGSSFDRINRFTEY
jgi:hypothetical protein